MKTTNEFRNELYTKFGKRLIVPEDAVYLGNKKNIKVICPKHGEKWMRPSNLLNGSQCRDCGYEVVSKKNSDTPQEFLEKAHKTHGDDYDYPYIFDEYGRVKKIHILCKKCGKIFKQTPALHIIGNGCSHCHSFPKKYTTETLKEKIKQQHPTIELLSEYNGDNDSKITVKCTKHNISWETTPHRLSQQKHACKECYKEYKIEKIKELQAKKFQAFILEHYAPLYDISQVKYVNGHTNVKLICPIHGEFSLLPHKMLSRLDGCPYCKESHLERETSIILEKLGIECEREKTYDWLKYKSNMFLDFYIPKYNIAIECQGAQHIDGRNDTIMTKKQTFEERVEMDKLKYKLCFENNIPIIYIFNKEKSSRRVNEQFEHIYDDAIFIEDINNDNNILLKVINEKSNKIN